MFDVSTTATSWFIFIAVTIPPLFQLIFRGFLLPAFLASCAIVAALAIILFVDSPRTFELVFPDYVYGRAVRETMILIVASFVLSVAMGAPVYHWKSSRNIEGIPTKYKVDIVLAVVAIGGMFLLIAIGGIAMGKVLNFYFRSASIFVELASEPFLFWGIVVAHAAIGSGLIAIFVFARNNMGKW